ncbi:MAG TPA: alpha/beta fold hydrolase [Verrucomicrobiae bacterium]|nr:alpha/beta fold hydrolase [Verrucomicrobiae bacterium]
MNVELQRIAAERNPVAVLRYEARRPRSVAIVAGHGYSSSKHNLDVLCGFLATHGFEVFSLDFPGHKLGASGGELRGMEDCIDAMSATLHHARAACDGPIYTMGHSMGAMTAIFTAALDRTVAGTIAIATGYGRPTALTSIARSAGSDFRASYVRGVALPELVEGLDERFAGALPLLAGRPQLYVAAKHDAMVGERAVRELFEHACEPKAFAAIESDHTFAADHARMAVLQWLGELHPRA